jgi:phage baseplate assembly protein W
MIEKAITLPFSFDSTGAVSHSTDQKKILQDRVVLVVMTKLNERVMRPTFGSEASNALFENIDSAANMIRQTIGAAFSNWLKGLLLTNVEIYVDPSEGYLIAEVFYKIDLQENEQSVRIKTAILSRTGDVLLEVNN